MTCDGASDHYAVDVPTCKKREEAADKMVCSPNYMNRPKRCFEVKQVA